MKDQNAQHPMPPNAVMIHLHKIIENDDLPGFVIRFAAQLQKRSYVKPSEFFEKLSDFESAELAVLVSDAINYMMKGEEDKYRSLYCCMLCAGLLARAEGKIEITHEDLDDLAGGIIDLTRVHMLHRKGTVEAYYDNFTIFPTTRPLFVAKPSENEQAT